MDKEVQLKIIEQLPEITKLAVKAMTAVRKVHESTLSSNEKSQENVHRGYQEARAAIIAQLQHLVDTLQALPTGIEQIDTDRHGGLLATLHIDPAGFADTPSQ